MKEDYGYEFNKRFIVGNLYRNEFTPIKDFDKGEEAEEFYKKLFAEKFDGTLRMRDTKEGQDYFYRWAMEDYKF